MFGTILFVPLFIQGVIGASASQSGTALMPMMMAMVAASIGGGQLVGRTGHYKYVAVAGVLVATIGMFLLVGMGPDTDYFTIVRNMTFLGLGMGATMPCFNLAAQNAVALNQLGVVTSLVQFLRSIGATLGSAIMGSVLAASYTAALRQTLPWQAAGLPPDRLAQLSNPQALLNPEAANALRESLATGPQGAQIVEAIMGAIRVALASALHEVFLASALISVVVILVTLLLPDVPLKRTFAPQREPAASPSA
jgi:MFS family permease